MAVHAESVIPAWVNQWEPSFYTKLTDMENLSYTGTGNNTLARWKPLFTNLVASMTSWKNANRQAIIQDTLTSAYGNVLMARIYGFDSQLGTTIHADNLFSMNSFISTTLGRVDTWYNDMTIGGTSARMTADIAQVGGYAALEASVSSSIKSTSQSVVSVNTFKNLFENVIMVNQPYSKAEIANIFFIEFEYKKVFQVLNVGSLTLPPSVS